MKRFALTMSLAACLVFTLGAVAMAFDNSVIVESKTVAAGGTANVGISMSNATTITALVLPLKIVAGTGTANITSVQILTPAGTRYVGKLNAVEIYLGYDPMGTGCLLTSSWEDTSVAAGGQWDPFLTHAVAGVPVGVQISRLTFGAGLAAGTDAPANPSFALNIGVGAPCPGTFEIDTICIDPSSNLSYVDDAGIVYPAFTKGVVTVQCNPCPTNTTNLADVNATVGSLASKALTATDDEPNTFEFSGTGNLGAITPVGPVPQPAAGLWSYTPTCNDLAGFDVVFQVYNSNGKDNCGSATFHVNVVPVTLTADCGADLPAGHFGTTFSKDIAIAGGCGTPAFTASFGDIDPVTGHWTFESGCQDVGVHTVHVDVTRGQMSADCEFDVTVTNNAVAACTNPPDIVAEGSTTLGPAGPDADGDALVYTLVSGTGWVDEGIVGNVYNSGTRPTGNSDVIVVTFQVSDGCSSAQCSFGVLFMLGRPPCIKIVGNPDDNDCVDSTLSGQTNSVFVKVNTGALGNHAIGGFDLLVRYDRSGLTFMQAKKGTGIATWEYFTFRTGMFGGNCGSGCPNGFIRLIGIADMNDGHVNTVGPYNLNELVLAELVFYVTPDRTYIGSCFHVDFYSYDCGDNVFSDKSGDTLYLPSLTQIPDGAPGYTEGCPRGVVFDDNYLGLACDTSHKQAAYRVVNFCSGYICVRTPSDDRGDLNLNGVANEISDAVLYSNYFIYGSGVWDLTWKLSQELASDVNADGTVLTIADLVYLIRIITGDAQPFPPQGGGPKLSPYANSADVVSTVTDGALTVRTNSNVDLGGALFVYRYSGLTIGEPALVSGTGLQIKSRASNGELRILVYGMTSGAKVPAGLNTLVNVPVTGNGTIELAESQVSDYNGALLSVNSMAKGGLPTSYALLQNYPNPFNAGTVIQFNLEKNSDWNLTIYNIAGQVVNTFAGNGVGTVSVAWNGTTESGSPVASGMYFYRLNARDFTATKKMVLMK